MALRQSSAGFVSLNKSYHRMGIYIIIAYVIFQRKTSHAVEKRSYSWVLGIAANWRELHSIDDRTCDWSLNVAQPPVSQVSGNSELVLCNCQSWLQSRPEVRKASVSGGWSRTSQLLAMSLLRVVLPFQVIFTERSRLHTYCILEGQICYQLFDVSLVRKWAVEKV